MPMLSNSDSTESTVTNVSGASGVHDVALVKRSRGARATSRVAVSFYPAAPASHGRRCRRLWMRWGGAGAVVVALLLLVSQLRLAASLTAPHPSTNVVVPAEAVAHNSTEQTTAAVDLPRTPQPTSAAPTDEESTAVPTERDHAARPEPVPTDAHTHSSATPVTVSSAEPAGDVTRPASQDPALSAVASAPPPRTTPVSTAPDAAHTPPPPPLPARPAPWIQGGGSVRIESAFTVLTVLAGAPLGASRLSAADAAPDKDVRLLRRAAVGLHRSGVARHAALHEWLLMHNVVLTGAAAAAAQEEEAAVRAWWDTARRESEAAAQHTDPDLAAAAAAAAAPPRVRVAGLPATALNNPLTMKVAFALLQGVRLVLTEYVLLLDVRWTIADAGRPTAAIHAAGETAAQREVSLALQTLSKNALRNVPMMVVDQERSGAAETAHAYRLQVYATQEWRQPERDAVLQSQLIAYVRKVQRQPDATATPQPGADTAAPSNSTGGGPAPTAVAATRATRVRDGLPIVAYSDAAHFHCQRAPLYGVRMPAPLWLRPHHSTTTAPPSHAGDHKVTTSAAPPPLMTLCEALISGQLGLGEAYAVHGSTFHRLFCQEWLQFTLLPSPNTPAQHDAGGAAPLLANARRAAEQREDHVESQRMDMTQRLGDGLCTLEWLAHLKAAQLHYREQAERERGAAGLPSRVPAQQQQPLLLSNAAGPSPYLDQYATLLFSNDTAQLSRVSGTYLGFVPNVSYALQHVRRTMEDKLAFVSLKYAVEKTRRFTTVKQPGDREVVCIPSHLSRVHRHAAMYKTQWFLVHLALRCVQHTSTCLGGLTDSDERALQNMDLYFSTTGKWSRGEFRVCMSAGVFVSDPLHEIP